jgi:hypothetical protein
VARASGLTASLLAHPVPGNLITPVDGPDHPAGTEVFTNDKFRSPPYPALRFYQTSRRIYPRAARDGNGHDGA